MKLNELPTTRIEYVKEVNRKNGFFFFSPDTMRFFSSRVSQRAYIAGDHFYFLTSEHNKCDPRDYRKYTVRRMHRESGNIESLSEFQEFETPSQARSFLSGILKEKGLI